MTVATAETTPDTAAALAPLIADAATSHEERTIRCNACADSKPESEFPYKNKATGRRGTKCKPCQREYSRNHHAANRAEINPRIHARNKQVRAATRGRVTELLDTLHCGMCGSAATGENDLVVRTSLLGVEAAGDRNLSALIAAGWPVEKLQALIDAAASVAGFVSCRRCLGEVSGTWSPSEGAYV